MRSNFQLPVLAHTKLTLGNGLDVIVRRQPFLPMVAVNLWYHVGSKDEERRQRGFAHLFEHLMFEGSQHYPGDFFKPLQRLGAAINGSTSTDRTNYFEDIPSAHFEVALAMESDRMGHLLPALSEHKLRVQKDVVKNEYHQNYANRPYGQVGRLLAEALYPPSHPYSWLTIGVMEDVEAATKDDVEAFFRRFYVPANASLCLVGDLDEDQALGLAEQYFGGLPGGIKALKPWTPVVDLNSTREIGLNERVELDRFYRSWPTVPQFHPDDAPLTVLADVLGRGKSSRLYRKLVVDLALAQDASAYHSGRELAGSFGFTVTLRPGKSSDRARAAIDTELDDLANHGPTIEELDRVVNSRIAGFLYALDNIGGFGGVADRLNAYNVYLGDPGGITSDLKRFQAVTPKDVREAARRYLHECPEVVLTVHGRKVTTLMPPIDRSIPPSSKVAASFRAPVPEIRTLACGVPLWVIRRPDLPIVAGTVVMPGGASLHGPDRGGLASLTSDLMDEGTTQRSSQELALAAERIGTAISVTSGWDGCYVGLQCLTPHLGESLDLAVDVLLNPTFPEPEFSRIKGQVLAGLEAARDSGENRAYRAMLRAIYGPAHPYGMPADGGIPTVEHLTQTDLIAFHREAYGPSRATWIFAGDVDPDTIAKMLDERLSGWTGRAADLPRLERPGSLTPRILLFDKPGAPQAVVRIGHIGTDRMTADFSELAILNQLLGGQFTSRLNSKLREEKGFTYGIRSQFDFRRSDGPFAITASLQADKLGEALLDIRGEVEAILDSRPPTISEIDDARRALIEGQARHFETPSSLVSRYGSLSLYGFEPDHHSHYAQRLDAVTKPSLDAAAARHLRPREMIAVVVADAVSVRADLERIGWGQIELVTDI